MRARKPTAGFANKGDHRPAVPVLGVRSRELDPGAESGIARARRNYPPAALRQLVSVEHELHGLILGEGSVKISAF
jgi:hypothetical protein